MDKIAITKGKLPPDDSSLGEPEAMLLKINRGFDSACKAFDVSSMTLIQAF